MPVVVDTVRALQKSNISANGSASTACLFSQDLLNAARGGLVCRNVA
jgi:hypothetical protein